MQVGHCLSNAQAFCEQYFKKHDRDSNMRINVLFFSRLSKKRVRFIRENLKKKKYSKPFHIIFFSIDNLFFTCLSKIYIQIYHFSFTIFSTRSDSETKIFSRVTKIFGHRFVLYSYPIISYLFPMK